MSWGYKIFLVNGAEVGDELYYIKVNSKVPVLEWNCGLLEDEGTGLLSYSACLEIFRLNVVGLEVLKLFWNGVVYLPQLLRVSVRVEVWVDLIFMDSTALL